MRFFKLLTLCVSLLAVMPVCANDGVYYTRGNHLVPLQETDISIRREVLTISLMDNGYARVDVQYEFWNPGNDVKRVVMGFEADPPYNDNYKFYPDGVHPNIRDFSVEMNGRMLAYRNAACLRDTLPLIMIDTTKRYYVFDNNWIYDVSNDDGNEPFDIDAGFPFTYVYYFDAEFKSGLNRVHHTYSYRMSYIAGIPYQVDYKLTPASRWAGGKIDDFTLVVRADNTAKHFMMSTLPFPEAEFKVVEGMGKIRKKNTFYGSGCEFSLRNGAVQLHLNDFSPQEELCIYSIDVYGNNNQFGYSYDRSTDMYLWYDMNNNNSIDKAFLKRIARNLPYANRGHVFSDPKLKEYFESLWWYMPDPNYKDSTDDFTEVDYKYINAKFE